MKTAIIYYPGFLSRAGGAFFHARNFETELRRRGWAVKIVTLDDLPMWCRYLSHMVQIVGNKVRLPFGFLYKAKVIKWLYRRFFNEPADFIVFEDIYIAWPTAIPSVCLLHATWSDNLQAFSVTPARLEQLKAVEVDIINALDMPLITVCEPYRRYLLQEHFSGRITKDVEVVELGRDQTNFYPRPAQQREPKSIIYAGTLEPRKNIMFMLQVLEQLRQCDPAYRLTILGDGPDRERLKHYASRQALPVTFLGKLPYEDVVSELYRHVIYLHTSVQESFSFALLEAKLAGLRTCAYARLQIPAEFIDVPVGEFSVDRWCDAIEAIDWNSPVTFVGERYTPGRMVESTLALGDRLHRKAAP